MYGNNINSISGANRAYDMPEYSDSGFSSGLSIPQSSSNRFNSINSINSANLNTQDGLFSKAFSKVKNYVKNVGRAVIGKSPENSRDNNINLARNMPDISRKPENISSELPFDESLAKWPEPNNSSDLSSSSSSLEAENPEKSKNNQDLFAMFDNLNKNQAETESLLSALKTIKSDNLADNLNLFDDTESQNNKNNKQQQEEDYFGNNFFSPFFNEAVLESLMKSKNSKNSVTS